MENRIVDEPKVVEELLTDSGKAMQEANKEVPVPTEPEPEMGPPNRHQRRAQKKIMEKAMKKAKGKLDFLKKGMQVLPKQDPLQGIQVIDKAEGTVSELYPIAPEEAPNP